VILCDHHIERAVKDKSLIIDPVPEQSQYDSSALNLRVGEDFRVWKNVLKAQGTRLCVDLDNINLADLIELTEPLRNRGEITSRF